MELLEVKVSEYQIPQVINFNYEEILAFVEEKCKQYSATVYTDDQIKQCRADRAALNKLANALDEERKEREKSYMEPFMQYKEQTKTLVKKLKEAASLVGRYDANYKECRKNEKRREIESYLEQCGLPDFVDVDRLFISHEKWLNASTSDASIKKEITDLIDGIEKDLATLAELPEYGFEAVEMYKKTLDINAAITEGKRLAEMAKRAEEARKAREASRHEMQVPERAVPDVAEVRTPDVAGRHEEPVAEKPAMVPEKNWIYFKALLSVEDARALKGFFASRGIEFEEI